MNDLTTPEAELLMQQQARQRAIVETAAVAPDAADKAPVRIVQRTRDVGGVEIAELQELRLAAKLALIAQECGYVQKDATNKFHGYKYASAAAVFGKINDALAKHRVCSTVHVDLLSTAVLANGRDTVYTVRVTLTVHDGETGERFVTDAIGSGMDAGDKGVMKAQTVALKYAWMLALNISTGDDPEGDDAADVAAHGEAARQPADAGAQTKLAEGFAARAAKAASQGELNKITAEAQRALTDKAARDVYRTAMETRRKSFDQPVQK